MFPIIHLWIEKYSVFKKICAYRKMQTSHLLDSMLNMVFISLQVNDKYKGIVIFNFLHSSLSSQWVLDNLEMIHPEKAIFITNLL